MNILIVEDNQKLATNIAEILSSQKYSAEIAHTVAAAQQLLEDQRYQLIVLDIGLPDGDGIQLCRWIREHKVVCPVLMLTAHIGIDSKVEGLDSGADDYLTKPFLAAELLARVRALLRRSTSLTSSQILCGELSLDLATHAVEVAGTPVELSPLELRLLEVLCLHRNETLTAEQLYQEVWSDQTGGLLFSDTLKVTIARLRKKIGHQYIVTVPGFGYRLGE